MYRIYYEFYGNGGKLDYKRAIARYNGSFCDACKYAETIGRNGIRGGTIVAVYEVHADGTESRVIGV
jgi:hypothetical protein